MRNLGEMMIFKSKMRALGFDVVKFRPDGGVYAKRVKREISFSKDGLKIANRVLKKA
ncbi:hypothetical protein [Campylobacter corcagiensis]|uniref:Uncharacterized protein n=1 Tax=Campylobacter corcagiensis TaxID=1448857 RepID=A0A7M1LFA4_9BACT|nr:hypothetical protein [Campylobacter corcagiensis]QKF64578.1 hypothetical protein CCORG_0717 [Campylobacter corcagiensis]QOQ87249.1 hypothetical protein IMC76_08585 [Campylobacter corcagiensis]